MHILPPVHREKTIFLALLALLVLGVSLSFLTWQNLRQQRVAVEQHTLLAAKAVSAGIESNIGMGMRHLRGMHPDKGLHRGLPDALLEDLMASPDVLFVGIISPAGNLILASEQMEDFPRIPNEGLVALQNTGQWHFFTSENGRPVLLFARRTRPMLARHFHDGPPAPRPEHLPMETRPYLLLGLDMSEHMAMYQDARRAAIWQTGYILGTAAVLWLALLSLLKRREQGRRVTELEYFQSQLLDNMPDGLLTLDCDNVIRSANPAAAALLGQGKVQYKTLTGKKWSDIPLKDTRQDDNTSIQNDSGILWNQYSLGNRFLEILSVPLREKCELGSRTLVLVRDRTQIKSLETSLQEAQRLAAIGRLAAAVAHEIRNPLSALRGFAQYFASKLAHREPEQTYARTMVTEADRLNRVITDLLFLAKPRSPEQQWIGLKDLYSDISTLIESDLADHGAEIIPSFSVKTVWADPDQLKQAVLNMVMNSLDALPEENGEILFGSTAGSQFGEPGTWVFVQDTGRGMDDQQREKALEPFYTTRKDGAGLGLAIVHKIMRDHGGHLEIHSVPGTGTTVRLFFPEHKPG